MNNILTEKDYQAELLGILRDQNGYTIRKATDFDRRFAIDREMLFGFLNDTQPETMEKLRKIHKDRLEDTLISYINTECTKKRGSLVEVLKHGVELSGHRVDLMYTKPATTFNKDLMAKYQQNRFTVMEEVWANDKERIDVVIFLNGFAIITMELKCNYLHLISISPFRFEGSKKIRSHYELISDLSSLDSFLHFNANEILEPGEKLTMREVYNKLENYFIKIMPTVLNGIHDLYNKAIPCYFDFSTMSYISLMNGFKDIDISKEVNLDDKINFQIYREFSTLGMIGLSNYPMKSKYISETIERPASRPEGKLICNMLREQRLALAKENNIPFESPECPSQGPCAGTCAKCDTEAEYLRRQLKKIPKEKRVFSQFDPTDIVNEPDYPIKKPEDRPVMYGDLIDVFKK